MGSYTQPPSSVPSGCRASPPSTCSPQMGRERMPGSGLYPSFKGRPSSPSGSFSQTMRPHRLGPHGNISTAPLPVSSNQTPTSRGAALAAVAKAEKARMLMLAQQTRRRFEGPGPCRSTRLGGVDLRVEKSATIGMICFANGCFRWIVPNTAKRQNGGAGFGGANLRTSGCEEFVRWTVPSGKALKLKSLTLCGLWQGKSRCRRCHGRCDVVAGQWLMPRLRRTSTIHDRERYCFTRGSTLSFQGARALFDPMEPDQRSSFLVWSHFLRRTGVHFVGKCSRCWRVSARTSIQGQL